MTISEMLEQSGILSLMGMGTVFLFLCLMILVMNIVAKLVRRYRLDKDIYPDEKVGPAVMNDEGKKPEVIAAITSAVNEYRKKEGE
jgi:oxaloacetate decarboxylase gamma subunit